VTAAAASQENWINNSGFNISGSDYREEWAPWRGQTSPRSR